MEIDFDQVAADLTANGAAELVTPDSVRAADVPDRWRDVLSGGSAEERNRAALSHWDGDFLALIPRFAQVLGERLVDVRVFWVDAVNSQFFVLVYVVEHNEDGHVCWMAWDPTGREDAPRFWDTLQAPVKNFLRRTHAGFTATDWESYGVMRPSDFVVFAEYGGAGWSEGIPGWMDGYEGGYDVGYDGERYRRIESTRMVEITKDAGHHIYCTSPDQPLGRVALVYSGDGDVDPPKDFGTELDRLMTSRLDAS